MHLKSEIAWSHPNRMHFVTEDSRTLTRRCSRYLIGLSNVSRILEGDEGTRAYEGTMEAQNSTLKRGSANG